MKTAATHRGNCQVCGHQQHVMGTGLAKHGYTVDFGYFNGTCSGSDKAPVQIERTITDATIVALGEYAASCERRAAALKSGETTPTRIKTGQKFNTTTNRYEPVYISFHNGTLDQQRTAVEMLIVQVKNAAHGARAHAVSLQKMADALHGTALVLIADLERKAPATPKAIVDIKAAKVVGAFGSKAARKEELDKINRLYEKQINALQAIYLALPNEQRTDAGREVYYAPMYPHQWKPRHSAKALEVFPEATNIVATIEELVKAREAVRAAP